MTLTILGNNSALPAHGRHPTAQVLQTIHGSILIDCGEGTQMQMSLYKIKPGKIHSIFISHLHGDHYFGLIGLLNSFALLSRTEPITIFAPAFLEEIINIHFVPAQTKLPFVVNFIALENIEKKIIHRGLELEMFPVSHRIPCWGICISEIKKARSIIPEKVEAYNVPYNMYASLQDGADYVTAEGETIKNEDLTSKAIAPRKYAYCADTKFDPSIVPFIDNADLIYHESTFLDEAKQRAEDRFHSTTKQAAEIARLAGAKKLLLGHFSSKYIDLSVFREEASTIFPNTHIAEEGSVHQV